MSASPEPSTMVYMSSLRAIRASVVRAVALLPSRAHWQIRSLNRAVLYLVLYFANPWLSGNSGQLSSPGDQVGANPWSPPQKV